MTSMPERSNEEPSLRGGLLRAYKITIWEGEKGELESSVGLGMFSKPVLEFLKLRLKKEKTHTKVEIQVLEVGEFSDKRGALTEAMEQALAALDRGKPASSDSELQEHS